MGELSTDETLRRAATTDDSAYRLLQLQQKLDACDRLYNEEIEGLRKELTDLTLRYIRDHEARQTAESPKGRKRGP